MKNKFFALFFGLLLIFGFILVGCNKDSTELTLDGTWINDIAQVAIKKNAYTIQVDGSNYRKGILLYTDDTLSFTDTHDWKNDSWVIVSYTPIHFDYTLNGNTLNISGGTGRNQLFNGDWTR